MTEKQIELQNRSREIARRYLSGETLASAGAAFGLGKEMVRRILLGQGITERRFWSRSRTLPTPEQKLQIKILNFWSRVALTADFDRCWEWTGGYTDRKGYGKVSWNGKTRYARHIALQIYNNKILSGYVLDSCGNNKCVNPHHLRESFCKTKKKD